MSDYTPTTDELRDVWADRYDGENSWADSAEKAGYEAEFDRWLAQHDAEIVKATEERIIALLESDCRPNDHDYINGCNCDVIALIKGENE